MEKRVVARIPFTYAGQNLDRGQVTRLGGHRNDEKLLGLKYFMPYDPNVYSLKPCDNCGRKFIDDASLFGHKRKEDCKADEQTISSSESEELMGMPSGVEENRHPMTSGKSHGAICQKQASAARVGAHHR